MFRKRHVIIYIFYLLEERVFTYLNVSVPEHPNLNLEYKGPVPKNVESTTFTFVSQFRANFEVKFLMVDRDCWLTIMFHKKIRFPENHTFRNRFSRHEHNMYHDIRPRFTSSLFSGHIAWFRN